MELLYFVLVGAVVGFLAGKVMKMDSSLVMTIVLGVVGGLVGGWGFNFLGISMGGGMVGEIIVAAVGAVVLIFVYKMISN